VKKVARVATRGGRNALHACFVLVRNALCLSNFPPTAWPATVPVWGHVYSKPLDGSVRLDLTKKNSGG